MSESSQSDSEDSGDICGIIEADGLSLEERPLQHQGSKGSWRISVLCVLPARPAVIEDEDGDLTMERRETDGGVRIDPSIAGLVGWRIELARVCSSQLERVGLQLWAGALVLSDFLLARPYLLEKQHVCELGAGLGLCSLLASRLGPSSILCTDGHQEAVMNCQNNLRRNGSTEVKVEVLRWENPPETSSVWSADVLLAADVIYDAAAAEAFAKLVAQLLKRNAKVLYMSLEKRVYFSSATLKAEVAAYPQFLEDCAALGLAVEQIDLSTVPVHFNYVRSRFYELVQITKKGDLNALKRKLPETGEAEI